MKKLFTLYFEKAFLLILIFSSLSAGCKKYLNKSPDKSLVIPSTIADLQSIMDYSSIMNLNLGALGEASSDNYYLTDASWDALNEGDRNVYIWGGDITPNNTIGDYQYLYEVIYNTNIVLKYIQNIPKTMDDKVVWDNVKGEALFLRAMHYQVLACNYSKQYDSATAMSDLGMPLRLDPDFNKSSQRSTVQQTYNQMINDLNAAITLLPMTPYHVMRPSKPAAYGLLSRIYLSMRNYNKALVYADSCLQLINNLMDYNLLDSSAKYPMPRFNREVIFHAGGGSRLLTQSKAKIDSNLYNSYGYNDLRKGLFFKKNKDGSYAFRGTYCQNSRLFQGIAADEMFLIKAECLARKGATDKAMGMLNKLLITRWKSGTFVPFKADNAQEALKIILAERRKELVMRNVRWMDLKRLNKEQDNQIMVKHFIHGKSYILRPQDSRYALPFPQAVIDITGMIQNPR